MSLLLLSLILLTGSGLAALAFGRRPAVAAWSAAAGTCAACVVGLYPVLRVLSGGPPEALRWAWQVPFGSFYLELDALSAFFLLPILTLSALASVYGIEYMAGDTEKKNTGPCWFFYNLTVAGMVLVVLARNGVLFLVAWEVMALASFFLVTFEDEREGVLEAGWTYLIATHTGTAFLFALFLLLGRPSGSLDFDRFGGYDPSLAGVMFILAVIGFGTKAGFVPFHVWLPEAHPAAPSHVSAVMSGVMIKTGIYGLLRILLALGTPAPGWAWGLIAIGLAGGAVGILSALAQNDLKRLLAYSSVENIGLITLGLGMGLLGTCHHLPLLQVLGYGGALLHLLNHAMFKGLLFLAAGSVLHATGTKNLNQLGGLIKRMPWTAGLFLTGAAAISGLPPLNGFASEFMLVLGALEGIVHSNHSIVLAGILILGGLAFIGGTAAACYTKAFGMMFLGEPRTEPAVHAHESGRLMRIPMLLLAAGCVAVGLWAPWIAGRLRIVLPDLNPVDAPALPRDLDRTAGTLFLLTFAAVGFIVLLAAFLVFRKWLLAGRPVEEQGTWDCGYIQSNSRMQYTASSFEQPFTALFRGLLGRRYILDEPQGLFPRAASLRSSTPDRFREQLFQPVFTGGLWILARLRWLQHGRIQLYILYIALTLLGLLIYMAGTI
ncbi:MAG: proton-conducting transporter membrane subunit [bacterium]